MELLSSIAIVILNYNHYELTINAIENINSFTNDIHIVVVDNNSPNESWAKLNEYCNKHENKNLSLIRTTENKGYACGNNFGIQYIRENLDVEFVAIMNPDVQIRSIDMLYKMMKVLNENKNVGAITAQTIFNNKVYYPNDSCWKFSN
ncbi:MAG: glycosyltransferase, partial [Anaeroplasmataceae bacterium]|nr:glycosyltransferase [Anaeroplasmataceae bacterium]